MVKFKSNIDCVQAMLSAYNAKYGNEFNNVTNAPLNGDTVTIYRTSQREVTMLVVDRRWYGSDLEIELHLQKHDTLSNFERFVQSC